MLERCQAVPYLNHPWPLAFAHRGFSQAGLENSMSAFGAAVDLGYRHVETDVHATRDGVLVALHDDRLDRVTDATGKVAALSYAEVSRARIGGVEPVPRLEDVLGTWPHLCVNIDVKSAGAVGPLAHVLARTRAYDRVCIASFSDRRRRAALRALPRLVDVAGDGAPGAGDGARDAVPAGARGEVARTSAQVATSGGMSTVTRFLAAVSVGGPPRLVAAALRGVHCLQVPETFTLPLPGGRTRTVPVVTARTLAAAHAAGVAVHVWTIDEPAQMHRLLDLGVDGLMTDRADLLREVLSSRGQWAP